MAGQRELVTLIPPVLLTMSIPTVVGQPATTALAEARILGSTDATYGTVGWTPNARLRDGAPFAIITQSGKTKEFQVETGRVRTAAPVSIFFAVAESDVPNVGFNFEDATVAWRDALRVTIPPNRRLASGSLSISANLMDVRWEMGAGDIKERYEVLGIAFYGVEIETLLSWTTLVQFQG